MHTPTQNWAKANFVLNWQFVWALQSKAKAKQFVYTGVFFWFKYFKCKSFQSEFYEGRLKVNIKLDKGDNTHAKGPANKKTDPQTLKWK